jgi:sugar phosphate isomerase/epimerase
MAFRFRLSLCNEIYQGWEFVDACRSIRSFGYEGIELAPFTLADDPTAMGPDRRREIRDVIRSEGLAMVGLHWLMVAPKGLHVTTPDEKLRRRSWQHVGRLVDLCADLADGADDCGVLVFGSPQQRRTTGGLGRAEATKHFAEGLAGVAEHAGERRVTVLIEALPSNQCDVVLSLGEAVGIVRQIGHPAVRTMFDVHNAIEEPEPHSVLVDRYFDYVRHVHLNENDGRHPGAGDYDLVPLLQVLARRRFAGWLSAEVFDFSPGAARIAAETIRHVRTQIGKISL